MRRILGVLAAIALVVAMLMYYVTRSGTSPGEVADLLTEGGEKVLREPMRPDRPGPRVLLFAFDGVGEDALLQAVSDGGAPRIAGLLGRQLPTEGMYAQAYAVPGVLSVLPSTTLAAWSSLFTGEPPARTGVPGNEWFVREEARFYAPAPVTVTDHGHAVEVYSDGLVGKALRVPTLYELAGVRSFVSLGQVHRGADLLTIPEPSAFGDLVTAVAEGVSGTEKVSQQAYAELDRTAVESLVESLRKYGAPVLQVVYFPGVDLYTHVAERPLEDQRRYLAEVVDSAVGRVLDAYRDRGAMEDTYVLFVADHGHTPVLQDDRHALEAEGEDEPPEILRRAGFRVRPFALEPPEEERDFQATVAYQGAFAYVYLADRSTCPRRGRPCDWRRGPRWEEDVLPVVRAFDEANRTGAHVVALRGTLDLIFAREPRPVGQDALPFRVWDGERLVEVEAWLAANPRPDLVDLASRLRGLGAGPYGHRAGDVLLLSRTGMHRAIEDRFYFSGSYRSWHGSPSAQDSRIPLVVAHPGRSGAELRDLVRRAVGENPSQLSVVPLVRALLEVR